MQENEECMTNRSLNPISRIAYFIDSSVVTLKAVQNQGIK